MSLATDILEIVGNYLPDIDVLQYCRASSICINMCDDKFWRRRILSQGYYSYIPDKSRYNTEEKAKETYIQLLTTVGKGCVPGSENYESEQAFYSLSTSSGNKYLNTVYVYQSKFIKNLKSQYLRFVW